MEAFLKADAKAGMPGRNDRMFIEAVLGWQRTGVPWRDLPGEFGPWQTVFNRFDRWSKNGKWRRLLDAMRSDPDTEWHSIDSTIHRAHPHAAGAKGGVQFTVSVVPAEAHRAKVHLIDFEITEGQRHDCVVAPILIERVRPTCLLGDKAVLASNENRVLRMPLDTELYKARAEVECTFNLLKQFRRFATRYEKTHRNYAAVVTIACAFLWLRI